MNAPTPGPSRSAVDWAAVRARLAHAAAALEGSREPDPAREREVLEARARRLAQPIAPVDEAAPHWSVVAFEIAGQVFGLEAATVRETVRGREITPLPGLPVFVLGLVNVRSRVVPAFDLRPLLHLPAGSRPERPTLVVASWEDAEFGLLVDRVLGARDVPADRLRREVPGLNRRYVRGLTDDALILLELPALFADLAITGAPAA